MNELVHKLLDLATDLFAHVNDNILAAGIGAVVTFVALAIQTRLANKDQEKNQYENFFFRDENDHRRILSWIIKEVEDVSINSFNEKNPNLRKSMAEYFLLLSSQYFRYKLARRSHPSKHLEHNFQIWEKNIRKNLDYHLFREGWRWCRSRLHLNTSEFAKILDALVQEEAAKDVDSDSHHLTP